MITLMKEITNAKVFLTHRLLTPPLHILCCASSQTSFKGGDVMVSIHEKHFGQPLTLQSCIILRQVFGYVEKVLELCGVEVTET